MNKVDEILTQDGRKSLCHRLAKQVGVLALGAAFFLAPLAPMPAMADSKSMTQLQYVQWIAQLSGQKFSSSASSSDYINWAKGAGLNPSGGWKATDKLTKDILAQTLVQMFGLNPTKFGGDYSRILVREGIDLGDVSDKPTKDDLVGVVDQFGFTARISLFNPLGKGPSDKPSTSTPHSDDDDKDKDGSHSNKKVTICHKGHTITVSQKALPAHLNHGDTIGSCVVTKHNHDRDDDDHDNDSHSH